MAWPIAAGVLTLAALAAGIFAVVAVRHRGNRGPQVVAMPPAATGSIASAVPSVAAPPEPASAMATAAAPPASTATPVPTTAVSLLPVVPPPRRASVPRPSTSRRLAPW